MKKSIIIATFTSEYSNPLTSLVDDALTHIMPEYTWKIGIAVEEFLDIDSPKDGDPITLPDICLIYLPPTETLPTWALPLLTTLSNRVPNGYILWVMDDRSRIRDFDQLEDAKKHSFLVNIDRLENANEITRELIKKTPVEILAADRVAVLALNLIATSGDGPWENLQGWIRSFADLVQ